MTGEERMVTTAIAGKAALLASGLALSIGITATPAAAVTVLTQVGADISTSPYTFSFMGGSFTFDGSGGFPTILSVQTDGGAAVRTVFGNPSTDFVNRGTVVYDANTLGGYGSFPAFTPIPFTNGDNFLGLRVTSGGLNYYGFAYTTNSLFNGYGFETTPGAGITATTNLAAAAVPEPETWALMLIGFFVVGGAMRMARRRQRFSLSYS
jgi:hypothetical protein